MIDKENKLVFIHIPKCAGTSVAAYFKNTRGGHNPLSWYRKRGLDDRYFFFTFVRNPFDRLVSEYFYFCNRHITSSFPPSNKKTLLKKYSEAKKFKKIYPTFEKLVDDLEIIPCTYSRLHFKPQITYFDHENDFDYIGRVESFEKDFKTILKLNGLELNGYKVWNYSPRKRNYRLYYNKDWMIEKVFDYYQDDFERFDYKF